MSINNDYEINLIEIKDSSKIDYNFNFYINKPQELKLKIIEVNGNVRDLEYNTDYIVKNKFDYYDGGEFTLISNPNNLISVGDKIVVYRQTEIDQQTNFKTLQAISPMNLTKMFDKLTVISQEIDAQLDRTVKFDFKENSLIDQTKSLNETNIKNLNTELNQSKSVAITLNYKEPTEQEKAEGKKSNWVLSTSRTDPDDKKQQGTEQTHGVYKIATQDEITTGEDNSKVITPLKLNEELKRRKADNINSTEQYNYTTPTQVRDYLAEKVVVANQTETSEGEDNTKLITPLRLKNEVDRRLDIEFINRKATQEDITAGTEDTKLITPLKLKTELDVNRKADRNDIVNGTNNSKYITPFGLSEELERRRAENITATDDYVYTTPTQVRDYLAEKVVIATEEDVTLGTDDTKLITPLKLGNEFINRKADRTDITTGTNNSKYVTPFGLSEELERRRASNITATDDYVYTTPTQVRDYLAEKVMIADQYDLATGINNTKFITPAQFNTTILKYSSTRAYAKGDMCYQLDTATSKPNIYYSLTDNNINHQLTEIDHWKSFDINGENIMQIATQAEITAGTNDEKAVSPLKLKNELDSRIVLATQEEVGSGTNDTKFITPNKLYTELNNRKATQAEITNAYDVNRYISPLQLKNFSENFIRDNIVELKEDFTVENTWGFVSNIDFNYEHVFLMSNLRGNANGGITILFGNSGSFDTRNYYFYSTINQDTLSDSLVLRRANWSTQGFLSTTSDNNSGITLGGDTFVEFRIHPNNSKAYIFTSCKIIAITDPAGTTRLNSTLHTGFYLNERSDTSRIQFYFGGNNNLKYGRIKHYIYKK